MDQALTPSPLPLRRIRMVAFPRFEMLDVVGPLEAFATATDLGGGYAVEIVSTAGGPVASSSGLVLTTTALRDTSETADTLLIAGGAGVFVACEDDTLVEAIRAMARVSRRVDSVCTGAMLLARAGLLDRRRAATHWKYCDRLARVHPSVIVERDPIFVRDGDIWTSAGVTAGIDLALAMIEADHGPTRALDVARELVVYLKRPGGQAQFSLELGAQATGNDAVRRAQDWISGHLQDDLSVEALAARAALSPRHFARVFRAATGQTPGDFVEAARVARAARLLEATGLSIEEIAHRSGFRSADVMRRTFVRLRSVTPGDYRDRFTTLRSP